MKNKILYVIALVIVGLITYWAGYKIGGANGYSDAIDTYMRVNRLTDPAREAAESYAAENGYPSYDEAMSIENKVVHEYQHDAEKDAFFNAPISTPTPAAPITKASDKDATIVYVYLDSYGTASTEALDENAGQSN